MPLAIALILIVVLSVLFQVFTPWWSTPVASNWGHIDDTLVITGLITGVVFIAVNIFIAVAIIRYRHREGHKADYQPENKKLEWTLIGLTTLGIVGMLAPGLFVYSEFVDVPEEADHFEVVGQQWQWSFRFPGEDGVLGHADNRFITPDNPFGLKPDDPNGADDRLVLSNEVHLPLNRPVKVLMRSKDVLHDFYVPQFRAKMDLVPGTVSYFWFTPTRPGQFEILCAELCGVGHYNMRGKVVVETERAYREWMAGLPTFAKLQEGTTLTDSSDLSFEELVEQGRQLSQAQGCIGCHSLDGSPTPGPTWLNLYGKQEELADGSSVLVDDGYLREAIVNPNSQIVKGFAPMMPPYPFTDVQLDATVAFIKSLSDKAPNQEGDTQ
ncbi:cytochrome c oxidase subunit II [Pseudomaricurvus alkylphenolicus]|jgi:cytochrome c oxidase subunit 2|uniref:cytochrome c oxidase subunit II n=1 Tax=Pseudomaricurvus alkylphenolicus TaxID=1306991 RepID=UPI001420FD2C|nr:cytochrome c oxidase subunit II [Pseudomaricurvus alkylphenolicus]NIB39907.1 cytochrome c oxidase subunit II [Pseudomaricurvus alkylphenolicus]